MTGLKPESHEEFRAAKSPLSNDAASVNGREKRAAGIEVIKASVVRRFLEQIFGANAAKW
jgi:hypothetical protein